jgi:hypothetical protein
MDDGLKLWSSRDDKHLSPIRQPFESDRLRARPESGHMIPISPLVSPNEHTAAAADASDAQSDGAAYGNKADRVQAANHQDRADSDQTDSERDRIGSDVGRGSPRSRGCGPESRRF